MAAGQRASTRRARRLSPVQRRMAQMKKRRKRRRPRIVPTFALVDILLMKFECRFGRSVGCIDGEVDEGEACKGEGVVIISNTVDVDVLEKLAASTLPK